MSSIRIIIFICFVLNVHAQNLVINGSFEESFECCKYYGQINAALGWFQLGGSTDYFNSCCPYTDFLGVPLNFKGYQTAQDGNAYAGIVLFSSKDNRYSKNGFFYREYLHSRLLHPLQAGLKYRVAFYYNLADSSKLFTEHLSICFSKGNTLEKTKPSETLLVCKEKVSITVGAEARDSVNWHLAEFEYLASGQENYIVIGFFDNDISKRGFKKAIKRNIINVNGDNCYYFIDNVSVRPSNWVTDFTHQKN